MRLTTGRILLEKKKANTTQTKVKPVSGRMNLHKEIPPDLIAVSSKNSPKFPKVMRVANKMAKGNAIGTKETEAKAINFKIKIVSNPLPTKSSTYFHKN